VSEVREAGYGRILDAAVTVGTVYPFFVEFVVPEGYSPGAIVVGDPSTDGSFYYRAVTLDTIPEPPG
jgi:hypothetical protein